MILTTLHFVAQEYAMVSSGSTCERVTSKAECEEAARQLSLMDTSAYELSDSNYPAYCYYKPSDEELYFNSNTDNTNCTSERNCLCKRNTVATSLAAGKS